MPPAGNRSAATSTGNDLSELLPSNERVIIVTDGREHANVAQLTKVFTELGETPAVVDIKESPLRSQVLSTFDREAADFPVAVVKGDCCGGLSEVTHLVEKGFLAEWLKPHKYDLVVIGGGSGGLAAAKEAAAAGKNVAVLDFVKPTPMGASWGLGGTCVNVGCIPKKLMHFAALTGEFVEDAKAMGWQIGDTKTHDWQKMCVGVQDYIASLNWGYRVQLREKSVQYLNSYGTFVGSHSVQATNKKGKQEVLTADRFLLAVGLRPRYPDVPGAKECCVTSDDLFSLPYCPGKTLCIGASYVSLECAGFLHGIGLDTTVMVRSILLRGFDQDMANRIGASMKEKNIKFQEGMVPVKFERLQEPKDGQPGRVKVTAKRVDNGELVVEEYDTVLLAIGRDAITDEVNVEAAGVKRNAKNAKVVGRANEQSVSAPWVYAIGDVLDGRPELTPVAIQAGQLLCRRLFKSHTALMDYVNVPTTVFTPLEYGSCGLSEEDAIQMYGDENIDVYHNVFNPLEHTVPGRKDAKHCYAKLIVNKKDQQRVLGLHILAPNAGEITQGFGIALLMKATKTDFDRLVGIHPTVAESLTNMSVTKKDQAVLQASGC